MRETSGIPCDVLPRVSLMRPPITIVRPLGTAMSVCTERVEIGGAHPWSAAQPELPGTLTSACTSSVTSPPLLMCGVTWRSTPVSMYCAVVVTALVVPPTWSAADRDTIADLDRRLLIVERGDVRIGDHLVLP